MLWRPARPDIDRQESEASGDGLLATGLPRRTREQGRPSCSIRLVMKVRRQWITYQLSKHQGLVRLLGIPRHSMFNTTDAGNVVSVMVIICICVNFVMLCFAVICMKIF